MFLPWLVGWSVSSISYELFCAVLCTTVVHNHKHTHIRAVLTGVLWPAGFGVLSAFCVLFLTRASLFGLCAVLCSFGAFLSIFMLPPVNIGAAEGGIAFGLCVHPCILLARYLTS